MSEKQTTKLEFGAMLLGLSEDGIKKVEIRYSGSGDDGAIDDVEPIFTEDEHNVKYNHKEHQEKVKAIKNWDKARDMIEEWVYSRLEGESDWVNNEGGEGYGWIEVPSGKYEIQHGYRPEIVYEELKGKVSAGSILADH